MLFAMGTMLADSTARGATLNWGLLKQPFFAISIISAMTLPAFAESISKLDACTQKAQQAFERGNYRQAERHWMRALAIMDDATQRDASCELCLKQLGVSYLRDRKYKDANEYFVKADELNQTLALNDSDLAALRAELAGVYRIIDIEKLGKMAADVMKPQQATMALFKTDQGNRVQLQLCERCEQAIDVNPNVDRICVDKLVTFDINDDGAGSVKVSNIKGFKIHSTERKMWVNLLGASVKTNSDENGNRDAAITVGKMGVTVDIDGQLSAEAYQPLQTLLSEMKMLGTYGIK
jgi:tetratricopeptide (TPR) repeat protein